MARYVLALKDDERIHVGETEDFIKHIGAGAQVTAFEPQRVIDLVDDWDVYDEEGFQLGAKENAGAVELIRVDPARRTPGAELVARITVVIAGIQARFDALGRAALADLNAKIKIVTKTDPDDPALAQVIQDVADAVGELAGFVTAPRFPVVHAELAVVVAALAEAFRFNPAAVPNKRGGTHDDFHKAGGTHP